MKNLIFVSIALLSLFFTKAQTTFKLDTIYVNDQKNVALFFPEPIRQGITGSDNFVFTYNRDKDQYFGLLQAKPGKETNLLVVTRSGSVFSYIIKYKRKLNKLNYFIPASKKIGNVKPRPIDSSKVEQKSEIDNRTNYYNMFCSYLVNRKQRFRRKTKRSQNIVLSVENNVFNKEELYFVIQIKNKSSLDYDLNFLNLSIETRKKGKKKSLQKLYQNAIFKYNLPSKIKGGETIKLVYVTPKFSLGKDRRAILELNESNGERNLKLKLPHRVINNPHF